MDDYKPFRTTRRITNLRQGRNDWYHIKNVASGPAQVSIYDEIGFFGVTAADFIRDLSDVDGDLEIHLNSPGGEVFDGLAIYAALQQRPGNVSIIVDALAASIGSVIAMAASPGQLSMAKNARLMIHDGFSMGIGNADDMRKLADLLDETSDNIASIYADRTGKTPSYFRNLMKAETWFSAQQAQDAGLADNIQGAEKVSNDWDMSVFASYMANQMGQPYKPAPYERTADENVKCPSCGKYNDNDSAFCGHCGVKLASRDDVDDAAETQTNLLLNSVDNTPWDGGKAMANGAASDDPASFYAGICAGQKAGDKSTQAAWALPYKYHPGDAPNAAGVKNALARLPQTEGLTNKAEAQATLEKAMKQVNPDYEASDAIDVHVLQALLTQSLGRGK